MNVYIEGEFHYYSCLIFLCLVLCSIVVLILVRAVSFLWVVGQGCYGNVNSTGCHGSKDFSDKLQNIDTSASIEVSKNHSKEVRKTTTRHNANTHSNGANNNVHH